jgi:hypothetical protein
LKFCASITARTQSPKTYSTNQPKVVRTGFEPATTSGIVSLTAIWIVHFHRIQLLAIASTIPPPDYVTKVFIFSELKYLEPPAVYFLTIFWIWFYF